MPTDVGTDRPDDVGGHLATRAAPAAERLSATRTVVSAPARLLAGSAALLVVDVSGDVEPGGSVVAVHEGGELARGELGPGGRALLTVALPVGDHTVRVSYDGSAACAPSAAAAHVVKVVPHPTLVTVAGSAGTTGGPVVLTATVHGDDTAPPPSGTVMFLDDQRELGSARVGGDGAAVLPTRSLDTGLHRIVAAYSGDRSHAAARSTPMPHAVVVRRVATGVVLERRVEGLDAALVIRVVAAGTHAVLPRATGEVLVHAEGATAPLRLPLVDGAATVRLPGGAGVALGVSYAGDAEHDASTVGVVA